VSAVAAIKYLLSGRNENETTNEPTTPVQNFLQKKSQKSNSIGWE
jgi:hypothetical protein